MKQLILYQKILNYQNILNKIFHLKKFIIFYIIILKEGSKYFEENKENYSPINYKSTDDIIKIIKDFFSLKIIKKFLECKNNDYENIDKENIHKLKAQIEIKIMSNTHKNIIITKDVYIDKIK